VQVDPTKPKLKAPRTKRLKLKLIHQFQFCKFAFDFNLRRYAAGLHNPILQIYVTSPPLAQWPVLVFLFTLSQLSLYKFDRHLSTLVARNRKTTVAGACTRPPYAST